MSIYIFTHVKKTSITNFSTLELLKSSVLISISGAFRVYLAALLLQAEVSIITCLASALIIYSVYTLDRALTPEEDAINRTELIGSSKEAGLSITVLTFIAGAYVFAKEGLLLLAFLPFVTGYLYSKGIKIGKYSFRLKGGLGVKNIVVGLSWGAFLAGIPGSLCNLSTMVVFLLYGAKTFINSVIDDFKDIKGDQLVGIKTLPICLGEHKTRKILLVVHSLAHIVLGVALVKGVIAFEPAIVLGSFLCGLVCILVYTNEEKYMLGKTGLAVFKDLESVMITLVVSIFTL